VKKCEHGFSLPESSKAQRSPECLECHGDFLDAQPDALRRNRLSLSDEDCAAWAEYRRVWARTTLHALRFVNVSGARRVGYPISRFIRESGICADSREEDTPPKNAFYAAGTPTKDSYSRSESRGSRTHIV
jgi:hypothetical protein